MNVIDIIKFTNPAIIPYRIPVGLDLQKKGL